MNGRWKTENGTMYFYITDKPVAFIDVDYKQPVGSKGKFYTAYAGKDFGNKNLGDFSKLREAKEAVVREVSR